MANEKWNLGYKEVKNVIHNEMGVTKEDILDVFRQVAKDEIHNLLSESSPFIYQALREVIQGEMISAVRDHRYPKVAGNTFIYGRNGGEHSFKDYISGVMKEEIINTIGKQFEINLDINKK